MIIHFVYIIFFLEHNRIVQANNDDHHHLKHWTITMEILSDEWYILKRISNIFCLLRIFFYSWIQIFRESFMTRRSDKKTNNNNNGWWKKIKAKNKSFFLFCTIKLQRRKDSFLFHIFRWHNIILFSFCFQSILSLFGSMIFIFSLFFLFYH